MSLSFYYPLGSNAPAAGGSGLLNGGFEDGLAHWTGGASIAGPGGGGSSSGWGYTDGAVSTSLNPYEGTRTGRYAPHVNSLADGYLFSDAVTGFSAGDRVTVSGHVGADGAVGAYSGRVSVQWLTAGDVLLQTDDGNLCSGAGLWQTSTVTSTAPATATKCRVVCRCTAQGTYGWYGLVVFDDIRLTDA